MKNTGIFMALINTLFPPSSPKSRLPRVMPIPPEVIPYEGKFVPSLGLDHDKLVKKSEILFKNDEDRYKWLMSIRQLRSGKTGWILEREAGSPPFQKWGLTRTSC